MLVRGKKTLTRKVLLGIMTASVLYGGAFVPQAEAVDIYVVGGSEGEAQDKKLVFGEDCNIDKAESNLSESQYASIESRLETPSQPIVIVGGSSVSVDSTDWHSAVNNYVELNTSSLKNANVIKEVHGGYSVKGDATSNKVVINKGDGFKTEKIVGGWSLSGNSASKNEVIINNGTFNADSYSQYIIGGSVNKTGSAATSNTVTINNGTFKNNAGLFIYGGKVGYGTANNNYVEITNGSFVSDDICGGIYGAWVDGTGSANNNSVVINGGNFKNYMIGATFIKDYSAGSNCNNNRVIINDGEFENVTIGTIGAMDGKIVPSTSYIDINGGTFNGGVGLFGDSSPNSVLNIYQKEIKLQDVFGFRDINFYLPNGVADGDTMLTVTGEFAPLITWDSGDYDYKSVDDCYAKYINVNAGISGSSTLNTGDTVTLIKYDGYDGDAEDLEMAKDSIDHAKLGTLTVGVSGAYDLLLSKNAENTEISATVGEARSGMNSDTKSMVETSMANVAMLNESADFLAANVMTRAQQDAEAANSSEMTPSFSAGGGKYRLNSGSHVNSNTYNMNLAFAKEIKNSKGTLMFAPFIEYGRGSYDSYLDNGVHGFGNNSFWGVGMMARQTVDDGLYYEGAIHGGRVKSDYDTNSLHDALGRTPSYDRSNMFYAMHVGVGKVQKISDKNTIDYYGKMFYSRQNSSSATLGTGEHYDFDAIDSVRMLLGARLSHTVNDNSSVYAGMAWQQEFCGSSKARWNGMETDAPTLKGATGILELGYTVKPDNSPVTIDLGINGKIGKQKGMGVNAKFEWSF